MTIVKLEEINKNARKERGTVINEKIENSESCIVIYINNNILDIDICNISELEAVAVLESAKFDILYNNKVSHEL
jgi:hypothetical protein